MDLTTTRAVVTGGGQGMGRTFVEQLRLAGAEVVFCDVADDAIAEVAAATGATGVRADVSNEADVERLFATAAATFGAPANVLINNAGILRDGLLVKKDKETGEVRTLSKAHWDAVIAVNLTGPFLCMRAFAAACVAGGVRPAVAVQLSSISRKGNPGQSNYSAAKAALVADTKLWAAELARYGVRTGAVAPGFVETPMVASMRPDALAKIAANIPLGRLARPEEIWQAIQFIIQCDYFTGSVIEVDGGLVL
jgi:3-oxoacyl-[acyl-carrier protein] reductase